MDKYTMGQRQNLKVWARRFGIELTEQHYEALARSYPGSVLVGPLTMVFFLHSRETIENKEHRNKFCNLAGRAYAKIIREEVDGGTLLSILAKEAKSSEEKVLFSMYSQIGISMINFAIAQRTKEKNKPNIANYILNQVR